MKTFSKMLAAAAALGAMTVASMAQEVTLRFHQMLPPQATIPAKAIKPWIEKVQADSGGRIKIERYAAMTLGGTPPQLIDQVTDGTVDIIWTVNGYTPGRFPRAGSRSRSSRAPMCESSPESNAWWIPSASYPWWP